MIIAEKERALLVSAGFPYESQIETMRSAGSDRIFRRIQHDKRTAVLMSGVGHGAALEDWLEVQLFLNRLGFGVPEIYAHDLSIPAILVEDLGKMLPLKPLDYPVVVRELARLAVVAGENIADCHLVNERPFDFDEFRRESDYFAEYYLKAFLKLPENLITPLNPYFDELAANLAEKPKVFCHRDFQSSNLLVSNGIMRMIDFQSAKRGPAVYDLASLLWDSRILLPASAKRELTAFFISSFREFGGRIDVEDFAECLFRAAISRTMQSLGAFCFLSLVKGKTDFERLIPNAERDLFDLTATTGLIPGLPEILARRLT